MLEPSTPRPQPPLPYRWSRIIGWAIIIGLVVAFTAIPSWRHFAVVVWNGAVVVVKKLFPLLAAR